MEISGRKLSPAMIVGAGMCATALIGFCGINPYLPGGGDNAGYIAEAEAWLTLGRRGNLYEAGAPYDAYKPPLFSLMLAAIEFCFGRSIVAMKSMLVLFAAGSVWAAWWAMSAAQRGDLEGEEASVTAAWVAFWFALCPTLGCYSHDVLSDVPFTFFTILAIGIAARVGDGGFGAFKTASLVAALTISILFRSAGIIAGGALCVYFAAEACARWRGGGLRIFGVTALVLAAVTIGFFAWQQSGQQHTYLRQMGEALESALPANSSEQFSDRTMLDRVIRVGSYYAMFLPAEVGGYPGLAPASGVMALSVLVLGTALFGGFVMLRRGDRLVPLVWISYQCVLLLWRAIDALFFLPVLPLFLLLVWTGTREIFVWIGNRKLGAGILAYCTGVIPLVSILGTIFFFGREEIESATAIEWSAAAVVWAAIVLWIATTDSTKLLTAIAVVFLSLVALRSVSENIVRERRRSAEPPGAGWAEFHRASQWLKQNAKSDDIVVSAKPSLLWFWSGQRGMGIPQEKNSADASARIAAAQWIVYDGLAEDRVADRYLKPLIDAQRGAWEVRWSEKNTAVLRRK